MRTQPKPAACGCTGGNGCTSAQCPYMAIAAYRTVHLAPGSEAAKAAAKLAKKYGIR